VIKQFVLWGIWSEVKTQRVTSFWMLSHLVGGREESCDEAAGFPVQLFLPLFNKLREPLY